MMVAMATPLADDEAFVAGRELYQQLEFEEALIRFQEVSLGEDRTDEERALAFVWAGLAYAQLGRFDHAAESFERGIRSDPDVALPDGVSPKIAKVFEGAAARAKKALAAEQAAAKAEQERQAKQAVKEKAAEEAAARKAAAAAQANEKAEQVRQAEAGQKQASAEQPAERGPATSRDDPSSTVVGEERANGTVVEQPPEASGIGLSMAYWAGAATGGVIGGALAAGGVGLFAASYLVFTIAASPTTPQLAAAQALTLANGLWFASIGVVGVGALALTAGVTSATLAVLQAE
jgi:hypothetical protein